MGSDKKQSSLFGIHLLTLASIVYVFLSIGILMTGILKYIPAFTKAAWALSGIKLRKRRHDILVSNQC